MRIKYLIILPILLCFGCSSKNKPTTQTDTTQTEFTLANAVQYGQYYKEAESTVLAIDFYSDGITLDENGYMQGSGTNLYFSDIFLPLAEDALPEGTYTADTTAAPYTFLWGQNYEGVNFTGCYLLNITEGEVAAIKLVTKGEMQVAYKGDSAYIDFRLRLTDDSDYEGHFYGIINYAKAD